MPRASSWDTVFPTTPASERSSTTSRPDGMLATEPEGAGSALDFGADNLGTESSRTQPGVDRTTPPADGTVEGDCAGALGMQAASARAEAAPSSLRRRTKSTLRPADAHSNHRQKQGPEYANGACKAMNDERSRGACTRHRPTSTGAAGKGSHADSVHR